MAVLGLDRLGVKLHPLDRERAVAHAHDLFDAAVGALGLSDMPDAPRWRTAATERIGDDTLETYVSA